MYYKNIDKTCIDIFKNKYNLYKHNLYRNDYQYYVMYWISIYHNVVHIKNQKVVILCGFIYLQVIYFHLKMFIIMKQISNMYKQIHL